MLNYKRIMNLYFRKDFFRLCCCSLWLYVASKLPQRKKYLLSCLFSKEISIYQVNLYPNLILLYLCKIQALDQLFSEILRTIFFISSTWLVEEYGPATVWKIWKHLKSWISFLFIKFVFNRVCPGLHVHLPSSYYFLTFFKMKVL